MTYNPLWGVGTIGTTGDIAAAVRYLVGKASTIDATPTTIISIPFATTGRVMMIESNVIGKTATPGLTSFRMTASFKNAGGTVSQVGATSVVHAHADSGLNTADVNFTVVGTNVLIQVEGIAATAMEWFGRVITTED